MVAVYIVLTNIMSRLLLYFLYFILLEPIQYTYKGSVPAYASALHLRRSLKLIFKRASGFNVLNFISGCHINIIALPKKMPAQASFNSISH